MTTQFQAFTESFVGEHTDLLHDQPVICDQFGMSVDGTMAELTELQDKSDYLVTLKFFEPHNLFDGPVWQISACDKTLPSHAGQQSIHFVLGVGTDVYYKENKGMGMSPEWRATDDETAQNARAFIQDVIGSPMFENNVSKKRIIASIVQEEMQKFESTKADMGQLKRVKEETALREKIKKIGFGATSFYPPLPKVNSY